MAQTGTGTTQCRGFGPYQVSYFIRTYSEGWGRGGKEGRREREREKERGRERERESEREREVSVPAKQLPNWGRLDSSGSWQNWSGYSSLI